MGHPSSSWRGSPSIQTRLKNTIMLSWLQYLNICHRDTAIALISAHFLSNVKNIALADSDGFITSERSATDLQM